LKWQAISADALLAEAKGLAAGAYRTPLASAGFRRYITRGEIPFTVGRPDRIHGPHFKSSLPLRLFRGATLTFQSLAIGGILFLICVVRREKEDSSALSKSVCVGFEARPRASLDADFYVVANSLILRQSAEMPFAKSSAQILF